MHSVSLGAKLIDVINKHIDCELITPPELIGTIEFVKLTIFMREYEKHNEEMS